MEKISIKFDEDNLTLGDLEDFEDAAGIPLFEAIKPVPVIDDDGNKVRDEKGRPVTEVNLSAKSLKALVWIVLRNERPGFTLDDARNIKVTQMELTAGEDDDPAAEPDFPPTEPGKHVSEPAPID